MGGMEADELDWDIPVKSTICLVGRTGNGKSATGNSLLGRTQFKSVRKQKAVTATCQVASVVREDGRCLSVIDTPGLFDSAMPAAELTAEIGKCIKLASEGLHALVLVLSLSNRFTTEEMAAVVNLQAIFGPKVLSYAIVLFTRGDELEEDGSTLEEYLASDSEPQTNWGDPLKELLARCGNRTVVFNNRSRDPQQKEKQVAQLLDLVDQVVAANGGKPYSNDLFREAQELAEASKKEEDLRRQLALPANSEQQFARLRNELEAVKAQLEAAHAAQLRMVTALVEEKLKVAAQQMEHRLSEAEAAREREAAKSAEQQEELCRLRHQLLETERQRVEMEEKFEERIRTMKPPMSCNIL